MPILTIAAVGRHGPSAGQWWSRRLRQALARRRSRHGRGLRTDHGKSTVPAVR